MDIINYQVIKIFIILICYSTRNSKGTILLMSDYGFVFKKYYNE